MNVDIRSATPGQATMASAIFVSSPSGVHISAELLHVAAVRSRDTTTVAGLLSVPFSSDSDFPHGHGREKSDGKRRARARSTSALASAGLSLARLARPRRP
jgi:hypothetical protein